MHPLPQPVMVATCHSALEQLLGLSRDQVRSQPSAVLIVDWCPGSVAAEVAQLAAAWPASLQAERTEFMELCSGARLPPSCEPAVHCCCGHRYGTFSGQLGDPTALYIGEVERQGGPGRWELQLAGAGALPPSCAGHSSRKVCPGPAPHLVPLDLLPCPTIGTTSTSEPLRRCAALERCHPGTPVQ